MEVKEKKVYVFSLFAYRHILGGIQTRHVSFGTVVPDKETAKTRAENRAIEYYPPFEGWQGHDLSCMIIQFKEEDWGFLYQES